MIFIVENQSFFDAKITALTANKTTLLLTHSAHISMLISKKKDFLSTQLNRFRNSGRSYIWPTYY